MFLLKSLNYSYLFMLSLSLIFLSAISLNGTSGPLVLFLVMLSMGSIFIVYFSNNNEIFLKIKLFLFFFSFYLFYALVQHYLLLSFDSTTVPYKYVDEATFYNFSNTVYPYMYGDKDFSGLFTNYRLGVFELPLHVMITSTVTHLSLFVDGTNTIVIQKVLAPFLGSLFIVILYATLKYQFSDQMFSLKATFVYGLLSAAFVYSTPMLRDIDIALTYIIFIYLFLQPHSNKIFVLLLLVAYVTTYLRLESGMVLYGVTLLYIYLYVKKVNSAALRFISYMIIIGLFAAIFLLMFDRIIGMVTVLNDGNVERSTARAGKDSIGILLNKLPFGISHTAKVLFGQLQPFPFITALSLNVRAAISGVFWPFIFTMMVYTIIRPDIRMKIDIKVKYLLMVAITILFLMSSEPMTRRMMSVFPIIYIVALYMFYFDNKHKVKRILFYYIAGIIVLNVFYYLIKIR